MFPTTYYARSYWPTDYFTGDAAGVSPRPPAPDCYFAGSYFAASYWPTDYFPCTALAPTPPPISCVRTMRRPSSRMTPNCVQAKRVTSWTTDAGGGRKPVYASPGPALACAAHPETAGDALDQMRDVEVQTWRVVFYDDPSLKLRDVLLFDGRWLVVAGVRATSGGRGRSWVANCEEVRPSSGG